MSHVEHRGANRWMAVWTDPSGRKRSKSFKLKKDANHHLAITEAAMLKREYVHADAGLITFGQYAAEWAARRPVRETTRARLKGEARYYDMLKDVPVGRLRPATLEDWQAELLRRGLAASTVLTVRAGVAAILRAAVRDQMIATSPLAGVDKPDVHPKRVVPLPRATVVQIQTDITPWYSASVPVGAGCGLRRGEAFGLTVDRVDFLRRRIIVDRTLTRLPSVGFSLGPCKTESSRRDVPLPDFVAIALAAHIKKYGTGEDGLVFHTRGGKPVDAGILADAWRRVAPAGSRFHDLRHHFASMQIKGGATVPELQALLGHATAKETIDTYTHLWPGSEDLARQRSEKMWAEPDDECCAEATNSL